MLGKRNRYITEVSIFLMVAALIAGMVGCDGHTPPSQNLEIETWYDLDAVRGNLTCSYILMNDLDSTSPGYDELASPTANGGQGWHPIGSWDARFTGTFDGRGYEIRNLFINRSGEDDVGLFGAVEQSGVIKNIGVTNATVIGQDRVGSLVGANWDGGTVSNSYSSSSVTGISDHYHVGGLVGGNEGIVTNSHSTGSVTSGSWVGGLVGTNVGTVSNSYSSSNVTSNDNLIGGLVGTNVGTVTNSYSTGNVTGNLGVGGLVGANGYSAPGTVSNSYSTGSVTGQSYVGGLVGGNTNEGSTVSNSYSTGSVTGNLSVGGLVGLNEGSTVTDSYAVGSVTGVNNAGGLVGENLIDSNVSNCCSTGSVIGESYVGGLVGRNEEGEVSDSYSISNVTGDESVGGLIGFNFLCTVSNSYSAGNVNGKRYVGGLVGWNEEGDVSNSYFTGTVAGNSSVGGLVGVNTGTVDKSYSICSVTGNTGVGGLVGENQMDGVVSNSFWDIETSGQIISDGGAGKTTAQMKSIATFSGAGWNIIAVANPGTRKPFYIWNIVDDETYPFLGWQAF